MFINLHAECIDQKFGRGTFGRNAGVIIKKCNQKCLDANKRLKSEKKNAENKELKNEKKAAENKEVENEDNL